MFVLVQVHLADRLVSIRVQPKQVNLVPLHALSSSECCALSTDAHLFATLCAHARGPGHDLGSVRRGHTLLDADVAVAAREAAREAARDAGIPRRHGLLLRGDGFRLCEKQGWTMTTRKLRRARRCARVTA